MTWQPHSQRMDVVKSVDYLVEPAGGLTLAQVRALSDDQWQKNGSDHLSFGYGDQAYWFRVAVQYGGNLEASAYLEIAYPVLDQVDVYLVNGGELRKSWRLGDKQPFYERPVLHRNFLVPLLLPPNQVQTLFLRVETTSSMQVPLTLWRQEAFHASDQAGNLFEGLYFGIVLVMILYNLFVFMAVGERSFLYYVGYITAMPLFIASLSGLAFQYLWPNATRWNDQAIIVFLNLVVVFGGAFTLRFLSVNPQSHYWLCRITQAGIAVAGLFAMAGWITPYRLLILPTITLATLGCGMMLLMSVIRLMRRDPAARYYTVAWVFMLFGGIVLALSKFTVLPRHFLTENATQIGSALGVILLSVALADRLNREKKTAFQAQQRLLMEERKARRAQEKSLRIQREANSLLEDRVQERTRDLEKLNARLMEMSATDSLTGLKNRAFFDRAFQSACVRAYRFDQPLSLLVIDIDHFKRFNDTYGHLVGDDCLQMVAKKIRDHVTRPQDLAARYGGEEFVVLLPETPEEGAERVAERIREDIERVAFRVSEASIQLTVSVGVSTLTPRQPDQTKALFESADSALYQAKEQGRNRVVVNHPVNSLEEGSQHS
ncbi:MAG: diguanylate cyclase [Marinobacter sp.]|uniref:sensor domain-containing diguanylate cyclase n=1 Tax=Marinobacter sp. TaxID=50741 RepID=UPI00299D4BEA|nr:diguanylate cyclase [Marinobacter sp.]MDX1754575.1 diguanylate cyclase [Marinobacter sp.]